MPTFGPVEVNLAGPFLMHPFTTDTQPDDEPSAHAERPFAAATRTLRARDRGSFTTDAESEPAAGEGSDHGRVEVIGAIRAFADSDSASCV